MLRGYRRRNRPNSEGASLLSHQVRNYDMSKLPEDFTWKGKLAATREIRDQQGCGSCWAFAAATVVRAHTELFQKDFGLSEQQIVACTPNLDDCGGTGGCQGATAELAMDYLSKMGNVGADAMPYTSGSGDEGTCPQELQLKIPASGSPLYFGPNNELPLKPAAQSFGMTGFSRLPENQLEPLMFAVYELGPAAVSVAAGEVFNSYVRGIVDSCPEDAVIDHAVMLVGWGEDNGTGYWHIQNSWGPDWGENGFIRMKRHSHHQEASYCGWDKDPKVGSGCTGGPPKVYICGHCGILSDAVVPSFNIADGSWWHRNGQPLQ